MPQDCRWNSGHAKKSNIYHFESTMNKIKTNFNIILIVFLLTFISAFCLGAFLLEKIDQKKDESGLQQLVQVIENAIWNFDSTSPVEFLKLAAKHQNYGQIIVHNSNDEVFLKINGPRLSKPDKFLLKIDLIKSRKFEANIFHDNQNIGRVWVTHYHDTIYRQSYLFLTLVLSFI
ncbi:MAG: hypothetical protein GY705_02705, partial [Bacteroidetes bacterium]|nr:hypothetical protein [Bacteroidota bacterium]